jgi:hypothetical protein
MLTSNFYACMRMLALWPQVVPAPQVRYWRPGTCRYLYIRKTKLASDDAATDQLASMHRPLYAHAPHAKQPNTKHLLAPSDSHTRTPPTDANARSTLPFHHIACITWYPRNGTKLACDRSSLFGLLRRYNFSRALYARHSSNEGYMLVKHDTGRLSPG